MKFSRKRFPAFNFLILDVNYRQPLVKEQRKTHDHASRELDMLCSGMRDDAEEEDMVTLGLASAVAS